MASPTRAVIEELHQKLSEVREIEGSEPSDLPHGFGNLKGKSHGKPPRLVWEHQGGLTLTHDKAPVLPDAPPAAGYRQAIYTVRIWMKSGDEAREEGECELVLDQLVRASRLLANSDSLSFEGQPYTVPTQTDGSWTEIGQVIDARALVVVPIPADPIDEDGEVVVVDTQIRTGIESPAGEPESETDYEEDQWVDPDQHSHS